VGGAVASDGPHRLARSGVDAAGSRRGGRSHDDFPLDPGLRRRTREAAPAASPPEQRFLARGRDLHSGRWTYLHRAVDSRVRTIDFLLSAKRNAAAAKRFFRKALAQPHTANPRTIAVDKNPAYPKAVAETKSGGEMRRRSRLRHFQCLHDIAEQDRRRINRLTRPRLGFGGFWTARRTLAGFEAMATAGKGHSRNIGGNNIGAQGEFIAELFRIAARCDSNRSSLG
jgi:hypothetical protein